MKITVALLSAALLLVYLGTWAQVDQSIQQVERNYFHTIVAWVPVSVLVNAFTGRGEGMWGSIPLPGGYLIGFLLLVNLLAAHGKRMTWQWKRAGVLMVHASVLLLLAGEAVRSLAAVESRMVIQEGEWGNYSYRIDRTELAIVDSTPSDHEVVTVVPGDRLRDGASLRDSRLPFAVDVVSWIPNARPAGPQENAIRLANAGPGANTGVVPLPAGGMQGADTPAAFVKLSRDGKDLGTYLVAVFGRPQSIVIDGRPLGLTLRFERDYKPYRMQLIDFSFDRYAGTNVPKNFSSRLRLVDPDVNEDREVLIRMNQPLRHRGEAFFQADWDKETERGTVLQVVRNPGWFMPYLACVIGGVGLVLHFGISLTAFLGVRLTRRPRVKKTSPEPRPPIRWKDATVWFPAVMLLLSLVYVGSHARAVKPSGPMDLAAFGQLPISYEGRVQPLDSVARNAMKILSRRETLVVDGEKTMAVRWLADVLSRSDRVRDYRVVRIDHPEVVSALGLMPGREGSAYSLGELEPSLNELSNQITHANAVPASERTPFQNKILQLGAQLRVMEGLLETGQLFLLPPRQGAGEWRPLREAIDPATGKPRPEDVAFLSILRAYHAGDAALFNSLVHDYRASLGQDMPGPMRKARFETAFNAFAPNIVTIGLYLIVMLLAAGSWLGWAKPLRRSAFWILLLAVGVHTLTLIARVYLSGRPPVTNLANSGIFIGWGAALLAVGIERVHRKGLATFTAGLVAFPTLVVAHVLSFDGDTMKVLQAVLDTNFWLATHVVCITLGYSAMFLAGIIAIVFVVGGVFTRAFDEKARRDMVRMIYGVTCFALLFSFVGTILGGIWADQSWGRFWGWDPKENGAAMIVLTTSILLHARLGGLVAERGIAALAIFGNIVTSWSWFGTNLLGVGLHSYGFMDGALHWLMLFVVTQLALIGLAALPTRHWRSYATLAPSEKPEEVSWTGRPSFEAPARRP